MCGANAPSGSTTRARSTAPRSASRCSITRRTRATPTYWHARAYGLLATNIFGLHDFERDPSRDASLTIRPGQPLRFRYRVIIHPGDVNSAGIRDAYEAWTAMK